MPPFLGKLNLLNLLKLLTVTTKGFKINYNKIEIEYSKHSTKKFPVSLNAAVLNLVLIHITLRPDYERD